MKAFIKSIPGKICLGVLALVLLAAMGLCGYTWWHYSQPKFQSVTIELGEAFPSIEAFLTPMADPQKAILNTTTTDVSKVGQIDLQFSHNGKEETVTLTVQDTVAPTATFVDLTLDIDAPITPEMFVTDVSDLSGTAVSFASDFESLNAVGESTFAVVVTDESGNTIQGDVTLTRIWMQEAVALELGEALSREMILLNVERDSAMISDKDLETLNKSSVGTYELALTGNDRSGTCTITITDTIAPKLELKNVSIDLGDKVSTKNFVKSCEDADKNVEIKFAETPSVKAVGKQTVTIIATDSSGNQTSATATLQIHKDSKPPVFSGLKAMSVKKNSSPNYRSGVKAKDAQDGVVDFTVDTSKVDLTKAGTYYITYTAVDSAGNKATSRRKITVTHSDEDTKALIRNLAAQLSNDPVAIMQYVRSTIKYNTNWGGDDPIWYGLKNKVGNCYVHAMILQAIFREKGIATQLIWVTNKSHYWNLVYVNGAWRHIDSTPGSKHPARLMTDEDRYANLQGRNWDRSKWPTCD